MSGFYKIDFIKCAKLSNIIGAKKTLFHSERQPCGKESEDNAQGDIEEIGACISFAEQHQSFIGEG